MRCFAVTHEFVEKIPDALEPGRIYISIPFSTAVHKCCCGCGSEVVTPFSPIDWELTFNGEVISLYPSIGNWNLPCQSHYWITHNKVMWARKWNKGEIERVQDGERKERKEYFDFKKTKKNS